MNKLIYRLDCFNFMLFSVVIFFFYVSLNWNVMRKVADFIVGAQARAYFFFLLLTPRLTCSWLAHSFIILPSSCWLCYFLLLVYKCIHILFGSFVSCMLYMRLFGMLWWLRNQHTVRCVYVKTKKRTFAYFTILYISNENAIVISRERIKNCYYSHWISFTRSKTLSEMF